jgi:hypothetical protein
MTHLLHIYVAMGYLGARVPIRIMLRIVNYHNRTLRFGLNPNHPGSPAFSLKASYSTTLQIGDVYCTSAILFYKVGLHPYIMDPRRILMDVADNNAH